MLYSQSEHTSGDKTKETASGKEIGGEINRSKKQMLHTQQPHFKHDLGRFVFKEVLLLLSQLVWPLKHRSVWPLKHRSISQISFTWSIWSVSTQFDPFWIYCNIYASTEKNSQHQIHRPPFLPVLQWMKLLSNNQMLLFSCEVMSDSYHAISCQLQHL